MADVPSEEDIAWLTGLGIKRIDLDTTFKYYSTFGKLLLENKSVLEKTARAVKPDERPFLFGYIFALPNVESFIKSGADLAVVCTHLININKAIGGTYTASVMTILLSKGMIKSIKDLEKIANIAKTAGKNATNVLGRGLPEVNNILKTIADVEMACNSFMEIARAAGKNADTVFFYIRPAVNGIVASMQDLEAITEIAEAVGQRTDLIFDKALPLLKERNLIKGTEGLKQMANIAKIAGTKTFYVLYYGLPAMSDAIKEPADIGLIGMLLAEYANSAKDVHAEFVKNINAVRQYVISKLAPKKPITPDTLRKAA